MSDTCSRNACTDDAVWWTAITVGGDLYTLPLCRKHMDDISDESVTGRVA